MFWSISKLDTIAKAYSEAQSPQDRLFLMSSYHKSNSNTGIKGIYMRQRLKHNAYEVSITCQGKYHYIGHFPTLQAALTARLAAEEHYFAPLIQKLNSTEC